MKIVIHAIAISLLQNDDLSDDLPLYNTIVWSISIYCRPVLCICQTTQIIYDRFILSYIFLAFIKYIYVEQFSKELNGWFKYQSNVWFSINILYFYILYYLAIIQKYSFSQPLLEFSMARLSSITYQLSQVNSSHHQESKK